MKTRFKRFFSVDNPKAEKAQGFGYLNAINYMAPHLSGGVGNLCPHASPGCSEICLGLHSGQAAMSQKVRDSRKRKAEYFMKERAAFMAEMAYHIQKLIKKAEKLGLKLCVRLNGATDIAFEGIRFPDGLNIFERFPAVQFVDYTKNPNRPVNPKLPANYNLTFSLSENNEPIARKLLARGVNVAAVFAYGLPAQYLGVDVLDGDSHDLRHLDKRGGYIIGLSPKGYRAKRDKSGFVIRQYEGAYSIRGASPKVRLHVLTRALAEFRLHVLAPALAELRAAS
jgi:hypothetical protein